MPAEDTRVFSGPSRSTLRREDQPALWSGRIDRVIQALQTSLASHEFIDYIDEVFE